MMNSTQMTPIPMKNYYIVCSLSVLSAFIAVVISFIILILVRQTKPRLHTVRHLLMCNTSIASIFYCIVQTNNYIFLIFLPWETSDIGCQWRGYFAYSSICLVTYSYFIQAISRFFISILSQKYKWLITFKTHYILIVIQWFSTIFIPLPAIVTKDIYFRRNTLCWVPLKSTIHVGYTYAAYYLIPALAICGIYIFIYYRVRKARNRVETFVRTANNEQRDLRLLRNILILLCIYLMSGIPTLLFLFTSNRILYLIGIVTISLGVAVEKVCTILLDRELREVIRNLISGRPQVLPFDNTHTLARYPENLTYAQRIIVQKSQNNQNISLQLV